MGSVNDSEEERAKLLQASAQGDVPVLRSLLAAGVGPNFRTADDESPLSFAVVWNQLEAVNILLGANADHEQRNSRWSPLMYAALEGNAAIVEALLKAGANPSRADAHGQTSADIAEGAGHAALAQRLREVAAQR